MRIDGPAVIAEFAALDEYQRGVCGLPNRSLRTIREGEQSVRAAFGHVRRGILAALAVLADQRPAVEREGRIRRAPKSAVHDSRRRYVAIARPLAQLGTSAGECKPFDIHAERLGEEERILVRRFVHDGRLAAAQRGGSLEHHRSGNFVAPARKPYFAHRSIDQHSYLILGKVVEPSVFARRAGDGIGGTLERGRIVVDTIANGAEILDVHGMRRAHKAIRRGARMGLEPCRRIGGGVDIRRQRLERIEIPVCSSARRSGAEPCARVGDNGGEFKHRGANRAAAADWRNPVLCVAQPLRIGGDFVGRAFVVGRERLFHQRRIDLRGGFHGKRIVVARPIPAGEDAHHIAHSVLAVRDFPGLLPLEFAGEIESGPLRGQVRRKHVARQKSADGVGVGDEGDLVVRHAPRHEMPPAVDELDNPGLVLVGHGVDASRRRIAPDGHQVGDHIDGMARARRALRDRAAQRPGKAAFHELRFVFVRLAAPVVRDEDDSFLVHEHVRERRIHRAAVHLGPIEAERFADLRNFGSALFSRNPDALGESPARDERVKYLEVSPIVLVVAENHVSRDGCVFPCNDRSARESRDSQDDGCQKDLSCHDCLLRPT